jgi:hypothetical protein
LAAHGGEHTVLTPVRRSYTPTLSTNGGSTTRLLGNRLALNPNSAPQTAGRWGEQSHEFWAKHGHEAEPETIGGMSGRPVFAIRHSAETDIMTYEFVGHIYEFSKDLELLYVRLARALPL